LDLADICWTRVLRAAQIPGMTFNDKELFNMLEQMRNAADKLWAKVLMGVLIFSFVGWGVASYILEGGHSGTTMLKVGSREISVQDFEHEKAKRINAMDRAMQKAVLTDKNMSAMFAQQILSKLSMDAMVEQRADKLGLMATSAGIAAIIRAEPAFQVNGKFDAGQFDAVLIANNLTEERLAASIASQIKRDLVLSGVAGGVYVPDFAAASLYNAKYARRNIEFVTLKLSDFKVSGSPDESKLAELYARNKKMLPEYRTIAYVLIAADMENPTDHDNKYLAAQKLEDEIISGVAFETAAAKFGAKYVVMPVADASGRMKPGVALQDKNMNAGVWARVFEMEQGAESEIIETKSGFMILQVKNIEASKAVPMNEMRVELEKIWRMEEQKKQAYLAANELMSKDKIGNVVSVGRADGAPAQVLAAAFANELGTKTIAATDDAFYVVRVVSKISPALDNKKRDETNRESDNMTARAIIDDYTAFLSREYKVKPNERLLKRLFN
jgi:hypothetical protein